MFWHVEPTFAINPPFLPLPPTNPTIPPIFHPIRSDHRPFSRSRQYDHRRSARSTPNRITPVKPRNFRKISQTPIPYPIPSEKTAHIDRDAFELHLFYYLLTSKRFNLTTKSVNPQKRGKKIAKGGELDFVAEMAARRVFRRFRVFFGVLGWKNSA